MKWAFSHEGCKVCILKHFLGSRVGGGLKRIRKSNVLIAASTALSGWLKPEYGESQGAADFLRN